MLPVRAKDYVCGGHCDEGNQSFKYENLIISRAYQNAVVIFARYDKLLVLLISHRSTTAFQSFDFLSVLTIK